MKRILFFIMLPFIAQILFAQELAEKKNEASSSSELLLQVASAPAMKLSFIQRYSYPFLQGESSLTKDNNIGIALTGELSPVSLNGVAEAVLTPIAFFQFMAGGRIGTGWNINLFGSEIYGIGLNKPDANGKHEHYGKSLDGLLWKAQTGAVLQADLAALFPGDWNHVVARSYHEINYKGYTGAAKGESWYYENDDGYQGENCNGFNYYGNFLIGYQMPIFLNMAALLAEANLRLYDTPGRSKWGDDLVRWTFSLILNFSITKKMDLAVVTQFWTLRNYLEDDWRGTYYRNLTINKSNPYRLEFYEVVAALSYKL